MSRTICSIALLICTAMLSLGMLSGKRTEAPVQAKIVTVSRNDVHQVVAISGNLAYADEQIVYANQSGVVSNVCVAAGQRVAEGEAFVRFDSSEQERVISTCFSSAADMDDLDEAFSYFPVSNQVIRCSKDCTVREVFVAEDTLVTAGMPIARVTSNQQKIMCSVAAADAEKINSGMWAWFFCEGSMLGFSKVESVESAKIDATTGLLSSIVTLRPEKYIEMPEGAIIDVEVYISGSDDVLSLPVEAITERDTVWWVNQGRCTEIPAQIVMCDEMHAWVNLPEGIQVAVGEFEEGQLIAEAAE